MDEPRQKQHRGSHTSEVRAEPEGGGYAASNALPGARVRRRLTLAELLVDPEASAQLTRETMWLQAIPPVGNEIG